MQRGKGSRAWVSVTVLVCVALGTSGCAGDSGGLAVATTAASPQLALEAGAVHGCVDCEGPAQFVSLLQLDLSADGTIRALDTRPPFARIVGPGGEMKAFADSGPGPGELQAPRFLYGIDDSGFVLMDYYRQRLLRFDSNGDFTASTAIDIGKVVGVDIVPDRTSLLLATTDAVTPNAPLAVTRVSLAASSFGSVTREYVIPRVALDDGAGSSVPRLLSFAALAPGVTALGLGRDYRISVLDESGSLARAFRRDIGREPKPPELLARQRAAAGRLGASRNVAIEVEELFRHFYYDAIDYDSASGRVWVLTARDTQFGKSVFDVFSTDGRLVDTVSLPLSVKRDCACFDVENARLAAVITDSGGFDRIGTWYVTESSR